MKRNVRINIPGITMKTLEPLVDFITPLMFILPLYLTLSLAQAFSMGFWSGINLYKMFQQSETSKHYCTLIERSEFVTKLNNVFAIGKSLFIYQEELIEMGDDEEASTNFIEEKIRNLSTSKGFAKILLASIAKDTEENTLIHQRGIKAKNIGLQQSTPIYKPNALVQGMPINKVNMTHIIDTSRKAWELLGQENFDAILEAELLQVAEDWQTTMNQMEPNEDHPLFDFIGENPSNFEQETLIRIAIHYNHLTAQPKSTNIKFYDSAKINSPSNLTPLEEFAGIYERVCSKDSFPTVSYEDTGNKYLNAANLQVAEIKGTSIGRKLKPKKSKKTTKNSKVNDKKEEKPTKKRGRSKKSDETANTSPSSAKGDG